VTEPGRPWTEPAFRISVSRRDGIVIGILSLAGIFDGLSGNPVHAVFLIGVALALTGDSLLLGSDEGLDASLAPPTRRRLAPPVALSAFLLFAVVVGGFARYSWPVTVPVVLAGTTALVMAWWGPQDARGAIRPLEPVGIVAWSSVFVGLSLTELVSLLLQPSLHADSVAHPTLSKLADLPLASHTGRTIGLFAWLALGWYRVRA